MKKTTVKDKLMYHFDSVMSRGTITLVILLFLSILILSVIIALLAAAFGVDGGIAGLVWRCIVHFIDPGVLGSDSRSDMGYLTAMSIATVCGMLLYTVLIGIVTTGFQGHLEKLRNGSSCVQEKDHTVILGFNDHIYTIINELVIANEHTSANPCIVVIDDRDPSEMEQLVRDYMHNKRDSIGHKSKSFGRINILSGSHISNTRIIYRRGVLTEAGSFRRCALENSRSVIINIYKDSDVIKIILTIQDYLETWRRELKDSHKNRQKNYQHNVNIVATMSDDRNRDAARIAGDDKSGMSNTVIISIDDAISRIIAHTCRQPGLSDLFIELFNFDANELYFESEPALVGKKFQEALCTFRRAVVFGIWRDGEKPHINPPMDTVIKPNDKIIMLEEDDGDYRRYSTKPRLISEKELQAVLSNEHITYAHEMRTLTILGCNHRLPAILKEYDKYVGEGSRVRIVYEGPLMSYAPAWVFDSNRQELREGINENVISFTNIEIEQIARPSVSKEALEVAIPDNEAPQEILILSNDQKSGEASDADTLLQLLFLREIAEKREQKMVIVSEMRHYRNQLIATLIHSNDFIVGSYFVNLMMTQISEARALYDVFSDLMSENNSELYIEPAEQFVKLGKEMDFYQVTAAVAAKDCVAIGYRRQNETIVTNPDKEIRITFQKGDSLIVLSEGGNEAL